MLASYFTSPQELWSRIRPARTPGMLLAIGLAATMPAVAGPTCKPALAFTEVRFSETQFETMERKWTALLSVDASRCATASGSFGIMFTRQKENGVEIDFVEQFAWKAGLIEVSVDFWADEAVEGYRLTGIAACPCRD